tara:strand:+ start:167 stop:436 length:270 start_codon:yes stop_codon:yes gene_type:complete
MKKLNTLTLQFKDTRSYFRANTILNLAFNFLDSQYDTNTIQGNLDDNEYKIIINLSFTQSSENYKLREILDLFDEMDFLAEEETESEED